MIRYRTPRHGGFTLIELLTVMAILATLTALVVAAVGRVRIVQMSRNTESTLTKLQQALDAQRKAVIDQCKQDRLSGKIPAALVGTQNSFCGMDLDMAESLWVYANLKREFPETFAEAQGDPCPNPNQSPPDNRRGVWLWYPYGNTAVNAQLVVQARGTFTKFAPAGPGPQPPSFIPLESAALLYAILVEKGVKGVSFAADDATASSQAAIMVNGGNFRVFTDAWGDPIWFNRLANYAELQGEPYVTKSQLSNPNINLDPIDQSRVPVVAGGPQLTGKLLFTMDAAHKTSIYFMAAPPGYPANPGLIDGMNKMITVYSAGPNKVADLVQAPGNTYVDDVIGYRLRRAGASGG